MAPSGVGEFVRTRNNQANTAAPAQGYGSRPDRNKKAAYVTNDMITTANQTPVSPQHFQSPRTLRNTHLSAPGDGRPNIGLFRSDYPPPLATSGRTVIPETQSQDRRDDLSSEHGDDASSSDGQDVQDSQMARYEPHANEGQVLSSMAAAGQGQKYNDLFYSDRVSRGRIVEETQLYNSHYPTTTDGVPSEDAFVPPSGQTNPINGNYGHDDGSLGIAARSGLVRHQPDSLSEHLRRQSFTPNDRPFCLPENIYPDEVNGQQTVQSTQGYHSPTPTSAQPSIQLDRPMPAEDRTGEISFNERSHYESHLPSPSSMTKQRRVHSRDLREHRAADDSLGGEGQSEVNNAVANETPIRKPANVDVKNARRGSLDFDEGSLFQMDFSTLMKQSFDDAPMKQPNVLPTSQASSSFNNRLALVSQMKEDEQTMFFSSLTKAEWEQCGDWFTETFNNLSVKLRKSREERRKIARGFEEEAFKRHKAVKAEIQSLDEAFSKMKSNGNTLLVHGTPKRKRT